jgi:enoyl-CoA hydratase/carnithine racemase
MFLIMPDGFVSCRPRNLNALTHNMVARLKDVLMEWAHPSSGVGCVVIKGAGGKV